MHRPFYRSFADMIPANPSAPRPLATRIITFRVKPGHEAEVQARQGTIQSLAMTFPGYLGSELRPPDPSNANGEWIVVYRHDSEESLNNWLRSPERAKALEPVGELLEEPPSEFTLTGSAPSDKPHCTLIASNKIFPGQEAEFEEINRTINKKAAAFPGFVGCEVSAPSGPERLATTLVRFDSEANLKRWMESAERSSGIESLHKLTQSNQTRVLATGFGSWFAFNAQDGLSAPAWKQAMVVLSVLFPIVMALNLTLGAMLHHAGATFPLNVFVGNAVGTVILTWLAMPVVSRLMDWWISPRCPPRKTQLGATFLVVLYIVEILFYNAISPV